MIPQRFLVLVLILAAAACKVPSEDRTLAAEAAWLASSHAFDADVRAFMVRYRDAGESEQARMLNDASEPRHKWTPRMRTLAVRFRGDPAAVRFDRWLLQNGGIIERRYADEAAARILCADLTGPRMRKVPSALRSASFIRGKEKTLGDLASMARRSPDPAVRTEALLQRELLLRPSMARVVPGMPAPRLQGLDFGGTPVDAARHRGDVVLVDFWGAWCGPCVAKVPMMKRVAARFAGAPFTIIGINSDRDGDSAARFVRAKNIPWQNIADGGTAGPVAKAWSITRWPTVIVIGRDGRIAAVEPSDDSIVPIIQRLLGGKPKKARSAHAL